MGATEAADSLQSLQEGPTVSRPTYRLIQVLRGMAALMVVAHHATIMLTERDRLYMETWIAGSSGVDIFFVISGFVMALSAAPLRRAAHPARTFLARRLERVVPLYWLVTTGKVVLLLVAPSVALNGLGSIHHIVASYLFLPSFSAENRLEPVVVVGWTLNFEMAFYALFAAALALRVRPLWALAPLLLLVPLLPLRVLLHVPPTLCFYVATVLWEFLFGMGLALVAGRVRRIPWGWGVLLVLGGLASLLTWNSPGLSYWRGIFWGLPALALVAGAVVLEGRFGARSPWWALEAGDASYSIYLIHTFTLPAVGYWIAEWPRPWTAEIPVALFAAVLVSALSGELVYRVVERPVMRWFKGRRRTAIPANA